MKLRKRDLFLLVAAPALVLGAIGTVGTVGKQAKEVKAEDVTDSFDFSTMFDNGETWSNQYNTNHTTSSDYANVVIENATHQTSTISNYPVVKGTPVIYKLKDTEINNYDITAVSFECVQWTTKKQTITLNKSSANDGTGFVSTGVTSNNFSLSASSLTDAKSIKFTFSSTSSQIGIKSLSVTLSPSGQQATSKTVSFAMNGGALSDTYENNSIVVSGNFSLPTAQDVTSDPYNGKSRLKNWKLGETSYNGGDEITYANLSSSTTFTAVWEQVGETISIEDAIGVAGIAGANNSVCTFTTIGVVTEVGSTVLTMKDPADENKTIKVYGSSLSTKYSVGSKIKVTGLLYMAGSNNDTPAFRSGATIEDLTPSISLSANNETIYFGDNIQNNENRALISTTLSNFGDEELSWTVTEGDDIVEITSDEQEKNCAVLVKNGATAGGTVTIKASATVDGTPVEKTIDLKVVQRSQLATAANLSYDNSNYKLSWDAVTNATSYKVTVTTASGAATAYTATKTTDTYLELANLVSGDYKFKVEAFGTDSTYVKYLSSASDFANFHLTVMVKALIENIMPTANLGFSYAGTTNEYEAHHNANSAFTTSDDVDFADKLNIGDSFTATPNKGSSSNAVYISQGHELRLYAGSSKGGYVIFAPKNNVKISKVEVTCKSGKAAGLKVGNDSSALTTYVDATSTSDDGLTKTYDVYSDSFFVRNGGTSQVHIVSITIHTINVTNFDDVSMKFRTSISDDIYSNIENITAVGARLSVDGSEQHIDFAGTAENITAGTNEHHFTFRVDDIPSSAFGTSMTIAPYITGNIDGEVQTVYLQEKTISVNGMIAAYDAMTDLLSAQQKLLISAFKTHYRIA